MRNRRVRHIPLANFVGMAFACHTGRRDEQEVAQGCWVKQDHTVDVKDHKEKGEAWHLDYFARSGKGPGDRYKEVEEC